MQNVSLTLDQNAGTAPPAEWVVEYYHCLGCGHGWGKSRLAGIYNLTELNEIEDEEERWKQLTMRATARKCPRCDGIHFESKEQ